MTQEKIQEKAQTQAHAIRVLQHGGPEVLTYQEITVPPPQPHEATIRQEAIGLNFIDIYHRIGRYPLTLPSGIGLEGAGVITAVGAAVIDCKVGDRIAYAGGPVGAYATERNIPADRLVQLPAAISFETGAAMMLQGMTAQYLLRRTFHVRSGDTLLIQAAAGGVGLIVCQWAKALGARVIGTVGSAAKAQLAVEHGCDICIDYTLEDIAQRVREITKGEGVAVVYDSVGQQTFTQSLDCLRPLGMMVSFGQSSGPIPPLDLQELSVRGSLFITRPTLFTYTAARADLLKSANELFGMVSSGKLNIKIGQRYALKDAATAHADLEGRCTSGSSVLIP